MTLSRKIDAEDVDYEEIPETGDPKAKDSDDSKAKDSERIDERPIKKESGVKKKDKSSSTLWAKILGALFGIIVLGFVILGILSWCGIGKDTTTSTSSGSTNITTGAKVKILVNEEETWVVPGDQITIDLETSRPNDFTLVTNLPGPGGSNDHYFKWDHDPEIILENGDGVKRKGNETFPASWGNVKYRVHSTVKNKKATFRLFKMER
jgi:hypothetical protein